ncbi:MAG: glycosyltransferase involved in cell wall biosynthesis [Candidatus Paceibacteria bacterium]|jgi:glycosyltransferase involved in cell wall biosynthesis
MRLLVFTQEVDKNDPIMGFFHNWILKLSKKTDSLIVICLRKGEYDLPKNVKVLSLGKEDGRSVIKYVFRFYKYIILEWRNYDNVFVHMNQEYVLLGGMLWRLFGKKVSMWRNHPAGNFLTNIAIRLSSVVFCTSNSSYTAKYKKTKIMPVGIDVDIFSVVPGIERKRSSILIFGRISPIKKVHVIVDALNMLHEEGVLFTADSFGEALEQHKGYYDEVLAKAKPLIDNNIMTFSKGIPNYRAPEEFSKSELYINATPDGSFDKTILEAMSCGSLPVVCNSSLEGVISSETIFKVDNPTDLKEKIKNSINLSDEEKEREREYIRKIVVEDHSLEKLINSLLYNL